MSVKTNFKRKKFKYEKYSYSFIKIQKGDKNDSK